MNTTERFISENVKQVHACEFKQKIVNMVLNAAVIVTTADIIIDNDKFNILGNERRLALRIISNPLKLPSEQDIKIILRAELKIYAFYDLLLSSEYNELKNKICKKSKAFYDIALNCTTDKEL